MLPSSTVCAISTPAGQGGIAVIRVSGNDAVAVCDRVFAGTKGTLSRQPSHTVSFGKIGRISLLEEKLLACIPQVGENDVIVSNIGK